jgi:hypothetical protein
MSKIVIQSASRQVNLPPCLKPSLSSTASSGYQKQAEAVGVANEKLLLPKKAPE